MLYERNYNVLTSVEIKEIEEAECYLKTNRNGKELSAEVFAEYINKLPDAFYYNDSVFPNNYLNIHILRDQVYLNRLKEEFASILNTDITERDILNFINKNKHYPLIGSIFHSGYGFGHHQAFLFKEFELSATFKADYLIIGKSSGGHELVFVELENPSGNITKKDGNLGETFRKGLEQVESWNSWIEKNYHSLKLVFDKYLGMNKTLPKELLELDKSRIHFVVIAGRRSDFNDQTYEIRRRMLDKSKIKLLHYDNLIDNIDLLKSAKNY